MTSQTFVRFLDSTSGGFSSIDEFKEIEKQILQGNKRLTNRFDYFNGIKSCGDRGKYLVQESTIIRNFEGSDFVVFRHTGPINGNHREGMEAYIIDKIIGGIFPDVDMTENYLMEVTV